MSQFAIPALVITQVSIVCSRIYSTSLHSICCVSIVLFLIEPRQNSTTILIISYSYVMYLSYVRCISQSTHDCPFDFIVQLLFLTNPFTYLPDKVALCSGSQLLIRSPFCNHNCTFYVDFSFYSFLLLVLQSPDTYSSRLDDRHAISHTASVNSCQILRIAYFSHLFAIHLHHQSLCTFQDPEAIMKKYI